VVKVGINIAKGVLATVLGVLLFGIFLMAVKVAAIGAVVAIGTIVFSAGIYVLLDYVDKKTQLTDNLQKSAKEIVEYLKQKMNLDYANYDKSIQEAFINSSGK